MNAHKCLLEFTLEIFEKKIPRCFCPLSSLSRKLLATRPAQLDGSVLSGLEPWKYRGMSLRQFCFSLEISHYAQRPLSCAYRVLHPLILPIRYLLCLSSTNWIINKPSSMGGFALWRSQITNRFLSAFHFENELHLFLLETISNATGKNSSLVVSIRGLERVQTHFARTSGEIGVQSS